MMERKKVLILGAGPAGLAAGYELIKNSIKDIAIIESEPQVGGLSKTVNFNDYYFDLGGHRFFSKIKEVNDLWAEVMEEEFLTRNRLSRIYYNYKFYNYPLQIKNAFLNLGPVESSLIFSSFLKSKLAPYKAENTFEEWVSNRFGKRLYETFFKTYTEKVWGIPCNKIQAEWAAQRIKGLSLISALLNALPFSKRKNKIKTLIDKFKYPKYGPSLFYDKLASEIQKAGGKIILNSKVIKLSKNKGWTIEIKNKKGNIEKFAADYIISSIPITGLIKIYNGADKEILGIADNLKYRDFLVVCLVFDKKTLLKDTWIYVHDKRVKMGRLQVIYNWSEHMVKNHSHSAYGVEYFCTKGDDIWNCEDEKLIELAVSESKKIKLIPEDYTLIQGNVVRCKNAYPVYDAYYMENISKIKKYIQGLSNLQVIGRGGMFRYNNMDHSIYTGILAARNIIDGFKYDTWSVNQDGEYHEEKKVVDVYEINPPLKKFGKN